MSIRFGMGVGGNIASSDLPRLVDRLEADGVDSLWFSELIYSPAVDPFVGMAFAASRTQNLKVGTSVAILPGRQPTLVAKQLISLTALAPRRVLPVFGLQPASDTERDLFPVVGRRGDVFDDSLRQLRTALESDDIRQGTPGRLDIWLGGKAPAAFRRIGALGDGWLGSYLTPAEAGAGVAAIRDAATAAGRTIDDDHFGMTLLVTDGSRPDDVMRRVRTRRPEVDPSALVATGWPALHRMIDDHVTAGISKFVIVPAGDDIGSFVDRFVTELLPRQT